MQKKKFFGVAGRCQSLDGVIQKNDRTLEYSHHNTKASLRSKRFRASLSRELGREQKKE